jgi:predicted dehydrogenase
MARLRVGLVGCGGAGTRYHAPALNEIEDVHLAAVYDRTRSKALDLARKYGVKPYSDLDQMLQKEGLDIVDVVTSEDAHFEFTVRSLEAGAHVLCEKPIVAQRQIRTGHFFPGYRVTPFDIEKAKTMIKTAEKAGRFLGINFNYRFSPHISLLKRLIEKGELGSTLYVNAFTHMACHHHIIDLMRFLAGEIVELYSIFTRIEGAKGEGENQSLLLRFEDDVTGMLASSSFLSTQHPMFRIDYLGTLEHVTAYDIVGWLVRRPIGEFGGRQEKEAKLWMPNVFERRDFFVSFKNSIEAFVKSIGEDKTPPVTGLDGLRAIQVEAAVLEANERKMPVKPY